MAAGILAVVVAVPVAAYLVLRLPVDGKRRALVAQLDRDVAAYHAEPPWRREPLRGPAEPGNAAEAAFAAADALRAAAPEAVAALIAATRTGRLDDAGRRRAADAALDALPEAAHAHLDALLRATRRGHARTDLPVEEGAAYASPDYPALIAAARMAMARARRAGPEACLSAAGDVVRLGQDLVPGASLVGVALGATLTRLGVDAYLDCAPSASREARAMALTDIERLVRTPPPVADGLATETLAMASTFRELTSGVPLVPTNLLELERWRNYREVVDAWQQLGTDPSRWRVVTTEGYPRSLVALSREMDRVAASPNAVVALSMPRYDGPYRRDAEAQCALRAAGILLDALGARAAFPHEPGALHADPAFVCPLTGGPLVYERLDDGRRARVRPPDAPMGATPASATVAGTGTDEEPGSAACDRTLEAPAPDAAAGAPGAPGTPGTPGAAGDADGGGGGGRARP